MQVKNYRADEYYGSFQQFNRSEKQIKGTDTSQLIQVKIET